MNSKVKYSLIVSLISLMVMALSVSLFVLVNKAPEGKGEIASAAGGTIAIKDITYTEDKWNQWYIDNQTFTISTYAELEKFSKLVGGYYRDESFDKACLNFKGKKIELLADINCQGQSHYPIGLTNNQGFMGLFEGKGHTIYNFKITEVMNTTGNYYTTGFFARLWRNGAPSGEGVPEVEVRNLQLRNYSIIVPHKSMGICYAAGLAGAADQGCMITNCEVRDLTVYSATVTVPTKTTMIFQGNVYTFSGTEGGTYFAGIVGELTTGKNNSDENLRITNCLVADIEFGYYAGYYVYTDAVSQSPTYAIHDIFSNDAGYEGIGPAHREAHWLTGAKAKYYTIQNCFFDSNSSKIYKVFESQNVVGNKGIKPYLIGNVGYYSDVDEGEYGVNWMKNVSSGSNFVIEHNGNKYTTYASYLSNENDKYDMLEDALDSSDGDSLDVSSIGGYSGTKWYYHEDYASYPVLRQFIKTWYMYSIAVKSGYGQGYVSVEQDGTILNNKSFYMHKDLGISNGKTYSTSTVTILSTTKIIANVDSTKKNGEFDHWQYDSTSRTFYAYFKKVIELSFSRGINVSVDPMETNIDFKIYKKNSSTAMFTSSSSNSKKSFYYSALDLQPISVSFKSDSRVDESAGVTYGIAEYSFTAPDGNSYRIEYTADSLEWEGTTIYYTESGDTEFSSDDTETIDKSAEISPSFSIALPKYLTFESFNTNMGVGKNVATYNTIEVAYIKSSSSTVFSNYAKNQINGGAGSIDSYLVDLNNIPSNLRSYISVATFSSGQVDKQIKISKLYKGSTITYVGCETDGDSRINYFLIKRFGDALSCVDQFLIINTFNTAPFSSKTNNYENRNWKSFTYELEEDPYYLAQSINYNPSANVYKQKDNQPILQNLSVRMKVVPKTKDVKVWVNIPISDEIREVYEDYIYFDSNVDEITYELPGSLQMDYNQSINSSNYEIKDANTIKVFNVEHKLDEICFCNIFSVYGNICGDGSCSYNHYCECDCPYKITKYLSIKDISRHNEIYYNSSTSGYNDFTFYPNSFNWGDDGIPNYNYSRPSIYEIDLNCCGYQIYNFNFEVLEIDLDVDAQKLSLPLIFKSAELAYRYLSGGEIVTGVISDAGKITFNIYTVSSSGIETLFKSNQSIYEFAVASDTIVYCETSTNGSKLTQYDFTFTAFDGTNYLVRYIAPNITYEVGYLGNDAIGSKPVSEMESAVIVPQFNLKEYGPDFS